MKRSELKQIIREVIEEGVYSGRVDVKAPEDFKDRDGNTIKYEVIKNGKQATYSAWIKTVKGTTDSVRRYVSKSEVVKDAKTLLKKMIEKEKSNVKEESKSNFGSYESYFKTTLREFDAKDIGDLSASEKKEFFKELEKGWVKEDGVNGSYQRFFMNKLNNEYNAENITDLTLSEKKEFFKELEKGWTKEK